MSYDLVIANGTVITDQDVLEQDIAISNGKIAALGQGFVANSIIDAQDKLVFPGAIDPHVHFEMPAGSTQSSDNWQSGSIAAACGGTTTVIDFVEPEAGQTLAEALAARRSLADGNSVIDYGLHMTICQADQDTLDQIPGIVKAGCSSFKTYLVYEGFALDDAEFLKVLSAVRDAGGLTLVHAENAAIVEYESSILLAKGHNGPKNHLLSRPAISEAEAIQRALVLAEVAEASLYIVHISTAAGLEALLQAQERGVRASGETCIQYLILSDDLYLEPGFEAAKYVCSPPLRSHADRKRLWNALSAGELNIVATDHCPFNFNGQKDLGRTDFTAIPGGLPGVESRLSLLYTHGVWTGLLSTSRLVEICCTEPAKTFGLYPQKGTIKVGADADLVVFDPEWKRTLSEKVLHENVDYTPYEGMQVHGYPIMTIQRGEILCRDGEFVAHQGLGEFIPR